MTSVDREACSPVSAEDSAYLSAMSDMPRQFSYLALRSDCLFPDQMSSGFFEKHSYGTMYFMLHLKMFSVKDVEKYLSHSDTSK